MGKFRNIFAIVALSASTGSLATAYHYEENVRKERPLPILNINRVNDPDNINPILRGTFNGAGVWSRFHYECNKDGRFAVIDYPEEEREWNANGEYALTNPDRTTTVLLMDGLKEIYSDEISPLKIDAAQDVAKKYCSTGEFDNPDIIAPTIE